MKQGGYEPAPLDREPGFVAGWWRVVREMPEVVRCAAVYYRVAHRLRDPAEFDSDDTHALLRKINPQSWDHYPGLDKIMRMPDEPDRLRISDVNL
jgi:hypothetical protein